MRVPPNLFWLMLCVALTACGVRSMSPTSVPAARAPAPVPSAYQKLYTYLETTLATAEAKLDAELQGHQRPLIFGAELIVANANRGNDLLTPETWEATRLYLDRLAELGVRGVKLSVQYPLFTPRFPNYDRYVEFFRQVAREVKTRNMKLVVQASVLFAGTSFSTLQFDFAGLTLDQFKIENRQMVQTLLHQLEPDYLVIVSEPDTAANLTDLKALGEPSQSVEFVQFILKDLARGTTKIAAGTGTWSPPVFAEGYARNTTVDCIVMHMYPVSPAMFAHASAMADAAKKHGKCILINEMWLYKTMEPQGGDHVAASEAIFKRDVYSFWQPLDQAFLRVMVKLADRLDAEFISPFWTMFFFSYVDYEPRFEKMSYTQIRQIANQKATQNLLRGMFSATGLSYQALIANHP